jgi:4'-phosphopantetheinyl transferase
MTSSFRSLPLLPLDQTEAHLWYAFPDALTDPALLSAYQNLLCPEECAQQQRFRFEKGRHAYLITHALLRATLSRYVEVDPRLWRFQKNAYGKPQIVYPEGLLPLSFNLSNTSGMIVCLVALDREVGVDVEDTERPGETVEVADQFFSQTEVTALRALPSEAQRQRFFEYWTLKEAYIKARGMGLSLPLEQFSFHLERDQPVRISCDPRLEDDPRSWQFAQFRPTPQHMVAVALRREGNRDLDIREKRTVPLAF